MEVVETGNLLPPAQYGFRSSHSTSQQLFRVCEHLTTSINRGLSTGIVALDLEKAFDKVWHLGLLMKLHRQGFSDRLTNIIRSYLSNRTFRVVVNGESSPSFPILSGVPQGSALGPILYSLYTSDLPQPTDRRTMTAQYADDTALLTTSKNINLLHTLTQTQLDIISRYYKDWGLTINPNKTQYLIHTRHRQIPPLSLRLNDVDVTPKTVITYLGLQLDTKLNFNEHIKNIKNKAAARTRSLAYILYHSPIPISVLVYKSYIRPILTYAAPVWYPLITQTRRKSLQISENNSLYRAAKLNRSTSVQILHNLTGTPLLSEYILLELLPRFAQSLLDHTNPTLRDPMTPKFATHPKYPSLNYIFNP